MAASAERHPAEGEKAPAFSMPTANGDTAALKDLKGKTVVLYFYPKADTSGCTKQAIGFTEHLAEFEKAGAVVIGVSRDPLAAHEKFRDKYDLGVVLASDAESKVCEAYDVWVEKNMYGRKYMGIERSTFVIDPKGRIARAWRKVKVPGHVEAVLRTVQELNG